MRQHVGQQPHDVVSPLIFDEAYDHTVDAILSAYESARPTR
jgi:hypothetical protein